MAKQYGTEARPSSRQSQTTPQDAPTDIAPGRTTRSTRSQSREPSEPPSITGSQRMSKKRGRKAKDAGVAELDTVDENDAVDAQSQIEALAADEDVPAFAPDDVDPEALRRESQHSGISGTTAKTSFSQEEIAELDADVMVDVLPSLATASEQLTKLLVPAEPQLRPIVWKEIRVQGSKYNKLFTNRLATINVHKPSFGSQEYILPSIVLRALLGVDSIRDVSEGTWRPDVILYKVNMARMLHTVLIDIVDPTDMEGTVSQGFELLETYFSHAIAGDKFDYEAFKMCVAIQAQLAIMKLDALANTPTFDPRAIISDTFFVANDEGELLYKYADELNLDRMDANDSTLRQAVDSMFAPFPEEGGDDFETAITALRMVFSWHDFVDQTVQYFERRNAQLDRQIAVVGGVQMIMQNLADEVQRLDYARTAQAKRESYGKAGGTPKKGFGAAQLKARQMRLSGNFPPPATAPAARMPEPQVNQQPPAATAPLDGDRVGQVDDPAEPPADDPTTQQRARSTLEHLSGFQNLQRQKADKGKQRFVDRQEHAQRVAFEDSQQDVADFRRPRSSGPGSLPASQTRTAIKRPHAHIAEEPQEFEPTQDEGFQADTRDTAVADARRRTVAALQPPRDRHPGTVDYGSHDRSVDTVDYETPASTSRPSSGAPPPSKRQRKNPGSMIPDARVDEGEANVNLDYERAKIMAKRGRIISSQYRPPQVRWAWTKAEEFALIDLIVEHGGEGVSYVALKKLDDAEDQKLSRRTAEDLRFKARNMKQTMILGSQPLPRNWEHVVLDRKAMDRLEARGFRYHQERIRARAGDEDGAAELIER